MTTRSDGDVACIQIDKLNKSRKMIKSVDQCIKKQEASKKIITIN